MTGVSIRWANSAELQRFASAFQKLSDQGVAKVAVRAINRTGDMAKTQVIRALTRQTGLKRPTIVKTIGSPKKANFGDLTYEMRAKGGDVSLKYFAAREIRRGTSAAPFGKRKVFAGAFMRGGLFPNRVVAKRLNGHVFERNGGARLPISKLKSGVVIPAEMVKGETAQAFGRTVSANLPKRIEHELRRLTGGVVG